MPDQDHITVVVDGVEVEAPQGAMLVDAAKHGDIEIPVFCYEPKLGHPVGASGNRIVLHLVNAMKRLGVKQGIATECIGGGQGGAMLIETV